MYIINKLFIKDVLNIFKNNDKIGMSGVAGAKVIPTNAIWWYFKKKYGKVYDSHTGQMELLSFDEVTNAYETVQAIDGLIMITQYDILWRQDIFDGWHLYDLSQCVEFKRAGYEDYRNLFLEEYLKDILSLVSILIPTYNRPEYFKLALESALNQTYKNIEIIVGDDSTNDEIERLMMNSYLNKHKNIKYYHSENNLGQFDNNIKLCEMAQGEYVNFLMADDLFEETKIQKMMDYFIYDDNQEISLVASHRAVIDDNGNNKGIFKSTNEIFKEDVVIDGIELGNLMLMNNYNCIGEPTTVLFRKDKLIEPFGVFNGRRYGYRVDQASWLNLLYRGKATYINQVLSYSRFDKVQQPHDSIMKLKELTDYLHMILNCRERGYLKEKDLYFKACSYALEMQKEYISEVLIEHEITKSIWSL